MNNAKIYKLALEAAKALEQYETKRAINILFEISSIAIHNAEIDELKDILETQKRHLKN